MLGAVTDAVDRLVNAVRLVVDHAASVDVWLLIPGIVLSLAAQIVRTGGWHTILRAAYPAETQLRPRHTCNAYLVGAGLNGVIPARGGDIVKLALVHRHMKAPSYATSVATFLPETVFETVFGTGLVAWALVRGFLPVPSSPGELPSVDVTLILEHPIISTVALAGLVVGGTLLVRWLRRSAHTVLERMRKGLAIFGSPRRFVTGVASWQALSRVIRLGSLAAFMGAFHLPVTVSTVVLVMAAQGGGRIVPIAPVSAGLRLAMLSYGFVETTGQQVDIAEITAFTVGVGAILLVVGLIVAVGVLAYELETRDPRHAFRWARELVSRQRPAEG